MPATLAAQDAERTIANTVPPRTHALPTPPMILVVDDEPVIRHLLQVYLEAHGFRTLLAASGKEALALHDTHGESIAMVLLDVRMPGLSGLDTLTALREQDPQIRCCFMTGDLGSHSIEELLDLGALHLFRKPLFLADLVAKFRAFLGVASR